MGDFYQTVRVAAVQAAPVFLDREGSTEKACHLIREAGQNGAQIIGFPEGFIPAHPVWYHLHAATGPVADRLSVELFKNSVEIPGPETDALCAAAREAQAYVVMGVCEKTPNTLGTMFNTQIFIGPNGQLLGKHQKIMPTTGERLVHTGGSADTLRSFSSSYGPISGLMCGENSNPLAVFAMTAENTQFHVMSWPNYFSTGAGSMRKIVSVASQAFAQMSKAFVISACATIDEDMIRKLQVGPEGEKFLRDPDCCGGSVIVGPNCQIIAGPLGDEEGILYADCNTELSLFGKLKHDFSGHYNRADIFQLQINRGQQPQLYNVAEDSDAHPLLASHAREALATERPLRALSAPPKLLQAPAKAVKPPRAAASKRPRKTRGRPEAAR
jgi:aliphatic nitrilase